MHGGFGLALKARGDTEIDDHHTVEDTGIVLGMTIAKALYNKKGINRFGHAYVPLDESLSRVVIDFSGRPGLHFDVSFSRARIGNFDVDLIREFFQGFASHSLSTIHIDNLKGTNSHHQAESIFKAFAKASAMAVSFSHFGPEGIPPPKVFYRFLKIYQACNSFQE